MVRRFIPGKRKGVCDHLETKNEAKENTASTQRVYLIAVNAIIAALYAALTIAIAPIAYGEIQFRVTEILIFLAFYDKRFIPGLIIGCFIANLASPMILYDISFGTAATALAVTGIYFCGKLIKKEAVGLFAVPFIGAAANGLLVGMALHLAFELPYWINALYVAIGEFAVLVLGAVVFLSIGKIPAVRKILRWQF